MAKYRVFADFVDPERPNHKASVYTDVETDMEYMAVQLAEGKLRAHHPTYRNRTFQLRKVEKR